MLEGEAMLFSFTVLPLGVGSEVAEPRRAQQAMTTASEFVRVMAGE